MEIERHRPADNWVFPLASLVGVVGVVAVYWLIEGSHLPSSGRHETAAPVQAAAPLSGRGTERASTDPDSDQKRLALSRVVEDNQRLAEEVRQLQAQVRDSIAVQQRVVAELESRPDARAARPADDRLASVPGKGTTVAVPRSGTAMGSPAGDPKGAASSGARSLPGGATSPVAAASPPPTMAAPPDVASAPPEPNIREYTVKKRQTLSEIARLSGVSVEALRNANLGRIKRDHVEPGDVLVIPSASPAESRAASPGSASTAPTDRNASIREGAR